MSARWRIAGPGIGPFRTTLASGRIGRRHHGSWWSHRFGSISYWIFAIWVFELAFWVVAGMVALAAAIVAVVRASRKPVRAAAGSERITP